MPSTNPKRVAQKYARLKTAGEVRFVKDRSNDAGSWGWGAPGPSERQILPDFVFNPKFLKPLAQSMRSALMALGHTTSAYNRFVKIKSRNVSPDGSLGGRGYIQKIPEMRRQLMNCVEALSAFTDTVYDELTAPHWNPAEDTLDPRDRDEVKEIVEDAEEIKDDPEGWAEKEEAEEFEGQPQGKQASADSLAHCMDQLGRQIDVLNRMALAPDRALYADDLQREARVAFQYARLLSRQFSTFPEKD